jgi:hypothetical protein
MHNIFRIAFVGVTSLFINIQNARKNTYKINTSISLDNLKLRHHLESIDTGESIA